MTKPDPLSMTLDKARDVAGALQKQRPMQGRQFEPGTLSAVDS